MMTTADGSGMMMTILMLLRPSLVVVVVAVVVMLGLSAEYSGHGAYIPPPNQVPCNLSSSVQMNYQLSVKPSQHCSGSEAIFMGKYCARYDLVYASTVLLSSIDIRITGGAFSESECTAGVDDGMVYAVGKEKIVGFNLNNALIFPVNEAGGTICTGLLTLDNAFSTPAIIDDKAYAVAGLESKNVTVCSNIPCDIVSVSDHTNVVISAHSMQSNSTITPASSTAGENSGGRDNVVLFEMMYESKVEIEAMELVLDNNGGSAIIVGAELTPPFDNGDHEIFIVGYDTVGVIGNFSSATTRPLVFAYIMVHYYDDGQQQHDELSLDTNWTVFRSSLTTSENWTMC